MDDNLISFFTLLSCGFLYRLALQISGHEWVKTYNQTFTFVILPFITFVITNVIAGNIALSLGMIGALSIVRFRAAIKEPEELVYLFLVISAGLGTGAGQIKITITGILFILIVISIYNKFYDNSKNLKNQETIILNLISNKKYSEKLFLSTMNILTKNCEQIVLSSMSINDKNTNINFDLSLLNTKSITNITRELKKENNFSKIIFANDDSISL